MPSDQVLLDTYVDSLFPAELYPDTDDLRWLGIASLHAYIRLCESAGAPHGNEHWWAMERAGQVVFVPAFVYLDRLLRLRERIERERAHRIMLQLREGLERWDIDGGAQ